MVSKETRFTPQEWGQAALAPTTPGLASPLRLHALLRPRTQLLGTTGFLQAGWASPGLSPLAPRHEGKGPGRAGGHPAAHPTRATATSSSEKPPWPPAPAAHLVPITNVPGWPRVCSAHTPPHHPDLADLGETSRETEGRPQP